MSNWAVGNDTEAPEPIVIVPSTVSVCPAPSDKLAPAAMLSAAPWSTRTTGPPSVDEADAPIESEPLVTSSVTDASVFRLATESARFDCSSTVPGLVRPWMIAESPLDGAAPPIQLLPTSQSPPVGDAAVSHVI